MGKGAILRWLENKSIARRLHGRGVEIGALWRTFPVGPAVTVWHIDRYDLPALRREYPELHAIVPPHVVADAARFPFAPQSLDFIIASHVLEHLPFPLAALDHWYSALRPGGLLVLRIPDKRYTFDRQRPRTPLQHLIHEHVHPETFDQRAHFEDWVRHVGGRPPASPELQLETQQLMDAGYSIHYHVWTDRDLREIVAHTREAMGMHWTPVLFLKAHFYRKECLVALRRDRRNY